jgi:subtilisin family serine protease
MKKILFTILPLFFLFLFVSCEKNITEPNPNDAVNTLDKANAGNIGINIVLNTAVTDGILKQLKAYGNVLDVIPEINGVRLLGKESTLPSILELPFVKGANPDAERNVPPIDALPVTDFSDGLSTWDLDVINVTDFGSNIRTVDKDGSGVLVLVLDTGLLDDWPKYFPHQRIASDLAKSFSGGGAFGIGAVAEQPNKWEHDQDSHGTHVTSTILGYSLNGTPINGVAPMATVVPVKVLNQNGRGWSSVIAEGILYAAHVKDSTGKPVVVNMSLGGPSLDALEKAAIDLAISKGVIIVASAGNNGNNGMGYPGAYAPVISVAASGWAYEFSNSSWWYSINDPDLNEPNLYYITDFSSRQLAGQQLDVAAPGSWIVGPYQLNSGSRTSYYYLGGTSMASPHVAGVVALMLQKDPSLTAPNAEDILKATALPIPGYTVVEQGSGVVRADVALLNTP